MKFKPSLAQPEPTRVVTSRRTLLTNCVRLSLGATVLLSEFVRAEDTCVDLDDMSSGEASMRDSLEFTVKSPNPKQTCSGCKFFMAPDKGTCGTCQIFNGPTVAGGHCTSWSPKS